MIHPSDPGAVAVPCPRWCAAGDCQWAPDGDEWTRDHTSWNLAPAGAPWVLELYRVEWLVDGVWHSAGSILVVNEGEEILGPCAAVDQLASCRRPDLN